MHYRNLNIVLSLLISFLFFHIFNTTSFRHILNSEIALESVVFFNAHFVQVGFERDAKR